MALTHLANLNTNYLSPILTTTGKTIFTFSKDTVVPVLSSAGKGVGTLVSPALNQTGEWMARNPGSSLLYAGSALTFFAPAVVTLPLFWGLGFTGAGPVAGSVAASIQAGTGIVKAGSIFATVQSASMGGYGASAVVHAVRIGSAGLGIFTGYFGNRNGTATN